jgi:hypothetical protein
MARVPARVVICVILLASPGVAGGCADARHEGAPNPSHGLGSIACGSPGGDFGGAGSSGSGGTACGAAGLNGSGGPTQVGSGRTVASMPIDPGSDGPAQCIAAGGRCLLGSGVPSCAELGPFDCNPTRNPGGAFCCLKVKPGSPLDPAGAAGAGGATAIDDADGGA